MSEEKTEESRPLTPGNKIRILRHGLGLTQGAIAKMIGVTRGTISSYEGRPNASPSHETIRKLADRFSLDVAWFYDGKESHPKPRVPREVISGHTLLGASQQPPADHDGEPLYRIPLNAVQELESGEMIYEEGEINTGLPVVPLKGRIADYRAMIVGGSTFGDRAPEGSVIYFRRVLRCVYGSIVVARFRGSGHFIAGIYVESLEGSPILISLVEDVAIRKWNQIDVWGAAVAIVRPYKEGVSNIEHNDDQSLRTASYVTPEFLALKGIAHRDTIDNF